MANNERLERIMDVLREQEVGLKQAAIARRLGEHPQTIARALVQLHKQKVLLQEDDRGRIRFMQS